MDWTMHTYTFSGKEIQTLAADVERFGLSRPMGMQALEMYAWLLGTAAECSGFIPFDSAMPDFYGAVERLSTELEASPGVVLSILAFLINCGYVRMDRGFVVPFVERIVHLPIENDVAQATKKSLEQEGESDNKSEILSVSSESSDASTDKQLGTKSVFME